MCSSHDCWSHMTLLVFFTCWNLPTLSQDAEDVCCVREPQPCKCGRLIINADYADCDSTIEMDDLGTLEHFFSLQADVPFRTMYHTVIGFLTLEKTPNEKRSTHICAVYLEINIPVCPAIQKHFII
ncbi:uncharacterized protein DEA37_0013568 [Paragonimus westermani]|uniref:NTR domain-containing protein n=1 Tax=Paragonimus westermani TaxID=34504 RepID=A0A5J4NJ98_9TREM|nr:uncharacterized protein DEA37_0013568 [Paragonimus westermani]